MIVTVQPSSRNAFYGRLLFARVAEANRRVFGRFGGYVRKVAKTSIKKAPQVDVTTGKRLGPGRRRKGVVTRDDVSQPDSPPFAHVGRIGQRLFFAYDPQTQSEVIGPEPYGQNTLRELEEGGVITIGPRGRRKGRRVTLRRRPFMLPAFRLGLEQLPGWYRDSVK